MKKLYAVAFALIIGLGKAQIGINTPNPLANLEVHRSNLSTIPDGIIPPRISADSLQLKDHLYSAAQNGALIYVTDPVSRASAKTQQVNSPGYYVYEASHLNKDASRGTWKKMFSDPNAFATRNVGKTSFDKAVIGASRLPIYSVVFDSYFDKEIGFEYIADNQYEVPETGLYVVNFTITINHSDRKIFSERPSVAIIKTTNNHGSQSFLDKKMFDGIASESGKGGFNISPSTGINHIYNLKKGSRLSFGMLGEDITSSDLRDVSTEISIYKIR